MTAFHPGPANLITDVNGLLVGNADDAGLKSGVTVLTSEQPFTASVHVMGGAPGTRDTDALAPDKLVDQVDALVLSGGSAFGLDAASGVMDALAAAGRGFAVGPARVPIVPAAILFDLLNGGRKDWDVNPYRKLGERALAAAGDTFAIGSVGAGTGATAADVKGGLGSATLVLPSGATVGALVAANPVGAVATPDLSHLWAGAFEIENEFGGRGPAASLYPTRSLFAVKTASAQENTTIAIVATDAPLSKAQAHRMAIAAHDGIARATMPAHTPFDGDLVFAAATGACDVPVDMALIGHAAAICLSRAIGRAVFAAQPAPGDQKPCWSSKLN